MIRSLDLDKILKLVEESLPSPIGKEKLNQTPFLKDKKLIEKTLKEVSEVKELLNYFKFVLSNIPDITPILRKAEKEGNLLSIDEFIELISFLDGVKELKKLLPLCEKRNLTLITKTFLS